MSGAYVLGAGLLALGLVPPAIVDGKPGMTHPLEFALYAMGAVSTAAAFLLLVWRVVRPHVEDYVERRVEAVHKTVRDTIRPMAGQVQTVRDEVPMAAHRLQELRTEMYALARILAHVDDTLQDHVTESRLYLDKAVKSLAAQGVNLPNMDDN